MSHSTSKRIEPHVGQIVDYVPRLALDQRGWYLVHCVGKSDDHVAAVLRKAAIDDYYPMIRELKAVPRRLLSRRQRDSGIEIKRPQLVPLLPRYRLLNIDVRRPDLHDVFELAGIGGMVCEGGVAVRVSQSFVQAIRERERDGAIPGAATSRAVFAVGETVRIVGDNPFTGFNAVVEEALDVPIEDLDSEVRIKVAVSLFGRQSRLDLALLHVEKL